MGKEFYIKLLDGTKVPVSEEIYRTYIRPQWRESKRRKIRKRKECSYEFLVNNRKDKNAIISQKTIDEIINDKILLEMLAKALDTLTSDELQLIDDIYFKENTEREASSKMGISQQLLHYRKNRTINKLKKYFNNF